jgi:Kef-type K+ transport system membrane component KefB
MLKNSINNILWIITVLIFMDIAMLILIVISIGLGEQVQHVPFWDKQIMFIVSLLK